MVAAVAGERQRQDGSPGHVPASRRPVGRPAARDRVRLLAGGFRPYPWTGVVGERPGAVVGGDRVVAVGGGRDVVVAG
jgi:hypothetical protein